VATGRELSTGSLDDSFVTCALSRLARSSVRNREMRVGHWTK
jgi:hypothetical protein